MQRRSPSGLGHQRSLLHSRRRQCHHPVGRLSSSRRQPSRRPVTDRGAIFPPSQCRHKRSRCFSERFRGITRGTSPRWHLVAFETGARPAELAGRHTIDLHPAKSQVLLSASSRSHHIDTNLPDKLQLDWHTFPQKRWQLLKGTFDSSKAPVSRK